MTNRWDEWIRGQAPPRLEQCYRPTGRCRDVTPRQRHRRVSRRAPFSTPKTRMFCLRTPHLTSSLTQFQVALSDSSAGVRSVSKPNTISSVKATKRNASLSRSGVYNLFAVAGRVTCIFCELRSPLSSIFCVVFVLLPPTEPSLLSHVCLAVFTFIRWTKSFY